MTYQNSTESPKVLVTGASGFIGKRLFTSLEARSSNLYLGRTTLANIPDESFVYADFSRSLDVKADLIKGADVIVHCAGRAHVVNEQSSSSARDYNAINVRATLSLAKLGSEIGTRRFIFISTAKAHGDFSLKERRVFRPEDSLDPQDEFSQSKVDAEMELKKLCADSSIELVIIRPPLVYGPGVKANFLSLLRLCKLPVPLPFGLVNNRRSMVYLDNLVDFIIQCIDHPNAANQTFLVSDGQDLSLSNLIRSIRKAMNKRAWLLPVPVFLFKLVGKLTGKSAVVDRLVGDLQVDSSKARQLLNWTPPYTVEQGIIETVKDFMNRKN